MEKKYSISAISKAHKKCHWSLILLLLIMIILSILFINDEAAHQSKDIFSLLYEN